MVPGCELCAVRKVLPAVADVVGKCRGMGAWHWVIGPTSKWEQRVKMLGLGWTS